MYVFLKMLNDINVIFIRGVLKMTKKYGDMYSLMENEQQAKQYFHALPDYVRDQMKQRTDHINSLESMQDYAENLLRGDD